MSWLAFIPGRKFTGRRSFYAGLLVGALLFAGCVGEKSRVRKTSDLREPIEKYALGPENAAVEKAIEEQVYTVLPIGSPEAGVLAHITRYFVGPVPAHERGSPPWEHDYFYRVEGVRDAVEIQYFIKDQKLLRVNAAYTRCSM